eukprot:3049005-Amphidinium_carterae.1
MCRTHGVDPCQAGRYHQVSGAGQVFTDDAFAKRHCPAALASTGMALRRSAFSCITQVCGQVKLDIDPSLPFLLRNKLTPFHASIVDGGVKGEMLVRAVIRPKGSSLRKDRTPFNCPSLA